MYYAPDKLAMLIFKFFIAMFLFSLVLSLANIAPFYLQLNSLSNDLVLRSAVNNYVLESQLVEAVNTSFTNNVIYGKLTYKGANSQQSISGRPDGVLVYARVTDPSAPGGAFSKGGGYKTGEYYSSFDANSRKVILNEGPTWDPKTNPTDTLKFRGPTYNGAQRGERITIRVEARLNCIVIFFGRNFEFQIPLAVEKSAPAMHYYRM